MPTVREIGRASPCVEHSTSVNLARLRASKEFGPKNPRWSADGFVIHDGMKVFKCAITGCEYVSTTSLRRVLFWRANHQETSEDMRVYMGNLTPPVGLGVANVENETLRRLAGESKIAGFVFRHPDGSRREGHFVRSQSITGHKQTLGALMLNNYAGGLGVQQCPTLFMQAIGSSHTDINGALYYRSADIPTHLRPGYVPPVPTQWSPASVHVDHDQWANFRGRDKAHKRLFGIELEILCNSRQERENVARHCEGLGWRAHGDCSIDSVCGIEINAPPYTYHDTVRPDGVWMQLLEYLRARAKGWSASNMEESPGREYGMHISMNRMAMTPATAVKAYACFHGMKELSIHVGGRNSRWAHFRQDKTDEDVPKKVEHLRKHLLKRGFAKDGSSYTKGECSSIRSQTRMEIRLFRSCLNSDRFCRNVQYCDAIWAFSDQCSLMDAGNTAAFTAWLSANQHHYPELASFVANMQPKEFKITSGKVKKLAESPEVFA